MDQVLIILAFLVGLVGLYFTYMIVNVVVTIIKSRERDDHCRRQVLQAASF